MTYALHLPGLRFYISNRYINLVVIVNAGFYVDKSKKAKHISKLACEKVAGQGLYPDRMKLG